MLPIEELSAPQQIADDDSDCTDELHAEIHDAPRVASFEECWEELTSMEKASVNMGKAVDEFRNYLDSERHAIVEQHYRKMREHQTVAYVKKMYAKYHTFNHARMTVWEAFEALKGYLSSDSCICAWMHARTRAIMHACMRACINQAHVPVYIDLMSVYRLCTYRYVDSSDPDTKLPNIEHALQTAEAARIAQRPDWFAL
jgi:inositol oxygenase